MKILSPAGNFECLKAAVYNGADEVYLGINECNARNNVDGFTLDTLPEAVDFAHFFGVKVLLAINILFSDSELSAAVNTAVAAYNMGVDALIVQDLGLIKLLSTHYPEIELHASTQMGIHNLEGVQALEKYNIKRVVLARETPLAEIARIKKHSQVELEYFCQGALCVSFSGNCYLSSYLFDASGNRGRCKQLCRLPFTLEKKGKNIKQGYLLSAKDFNMSKRLHQLDDVGIDVIKIEGRARRPFYVAMTTREYRNALRDTTVSQNNIKLAFNREYTAGYFDGNGSIISNIQNHIGIKIGRVEKVNFGKKFNQVYIFSDRVLSPKSTFKFLGAGETTLTAYDLQRLDRGRYVLTTTQKVACNDEVYLIVDNALETEVLSFEKKRPLKISIDAYPNSEITASITIDGNSFSVSGDICQTAQSHPLTEEEILSNFAKSGMFDVEVDVNTAGAFLPKRTLNEFRRMVFDCAYQYIVNKYKRDLPACNIEKKGKAIAFDDCDFVDTCRFSSTATNIVYSPETYTLKDVEEFIQQCKKEDKIPYLDTPNFALEKDIALLSDIIAATGISIVANNYYALTLDTQIVIGGGLNVYNTIAAKEHNRPIISAEGSVGAHRTYPYMTLRHCPLKAHLSASCDHCPYSGDYTYRMDNGKVLKLKRKKLSTCTFYLMDI